MYEDGYGGYAGVGTYLPGHGPQAQRLNYFNMARNLFPFTPDAAPLKVTEVIKAAREIEAYLNGENN